MRSELPSICQAWLDDLTCRGRHPTTVAAYRASMAHFLAWYSIAYGDAFQPTQVMARDIRDWQAGQQQVEHAAPATMNRRLVALKQFFQWTMRVHHVPDDPTVEVHTIRLGPPTLRSLEPADARRLLRAAKLHLRDYAILEVLLGTGIRVGELLHLHVGDVTVRERSGLLIVRAGKRDSYREIPLSVDVRQALRAYVDRAHPAATNPRAALWIGSAGPLTQRSSILRVLTKYALRTGLPCREPYKLARSEC